MPAAKIRRAGRDDENTQKARGNAAYFGRGTVYSPGYERETKVTRNKSREPSKMPSLQKAASRRINAK